VLSPTSVMECEYDPFLSVKIKQKRKSNSRWRRPWRSQLKRFVLFNILPR